MRQKQVPKTKTARKRTTFPWGLVSLFVMLPISVVVAVLFFVNIAETAAITTSPYALVPGTEDYTGETVYAAFSVSGWIGAITASGVAFLLASFILMRFLDGNFKDLLNQGTFIITFLGIMISAGIATGVQMSAPNDSSFPVKNAMVVYSESGLTMEETVQKDLQFDADSANKKVYLAQNTDDGGYYYKYLGTGEEVLTSMKESVK